VPAPAAVISHLGPQRRIVRNQELLKFNGII
jgi:hypothetical protein